MKKELIDMDSELMKAELAVEKGRLMSTELFERLNSIESDGYKLISWDANRTRADIVMDYIVWADEALKAVREQCNKLFEELRKKTEREQREAAENSAPSESSEALTYRATTIQLLNRIHSVDALRKIYTIAKRLEAWGRTSC